MKKFLIGILFLAVAGVSCSKVPVVGRSQLSLIPENTLLTESFQEYDSFINASQVVTGTNEAQMVQTVGSRLAASTTSYLQNNGYADRAKEFQWEYHLVQNQEANAFCMPGGKIAVYTGIMPIAQDEKGLAVVMGHEISHAVARHGDERLSQQLALQLGGEALDKALSQKPAQTRQIWDVAYGVTANYGLILPFSRQQEAEADKLGMIFMAMAGYDPHAALDFWQRMISAGGAQPPVFLSDHPSNEQRVKNIQAFMNKAMQYYKPNP